MKTLRLPELGMALALAATPALAPRLLARDTAALDLARHLLLGVEVGGVDSGIAEFRDASGTLLAAGQGVFTTTSILQAAAGLPTVAIAIYGGRAIRPRLSEFWFRTLSMAVLVFTAGVSLVSEIGRAHV